LADALEGDRLHLLEQPRKVSVVAAAPIPAAHPQALHRAETFLALQALEDAPQEAGEPADVGVERLILGADVQVGHRLFVTRDAATEKPRVPLSHALCGMCRLAT